MLGGAEFKFVGALPPFPLIAALLETAEELLGLRDKLSPAHQSTTLGGVFTLSLSASREAAKTNFLFFGLIRPGIEPKSTVLASDTLSTLTDLDYE